MWGRTSSFPRDGKVQYRLQQFSADEGNEKVELRNAIFHFMCGVAEQHSRDREKNFTMLVHTSGKIDEHSDDVKVIRETIDILASSEHPNFMTCVNNLLKIADGYGCDGSESIVEFILRNINRHQVDIINSTGKNQRTGILIPPTVFSFGVGGNIVSRGVTFDNLLSMYFTRSVKGKFQQDTYIQRARMFGARNQYKESFQLWVPETLMQNWGKCFAYHQLAVQSIRADSGAPVWLSDHKTTPTSPSSIDRTAVDFEDGEMSWALFDYDDSVHEKAMCQSGKSDLEKLESLGRIFKSTEFPDHVRQYIAHDARGEDGKVCFHGASLFGGATSRYTPSEIRNVRRKKGIFSTNEFERGGRKDARHHLKIFYNPNRKARLFYKINGRSIKFIQKRK